MVCDFTFGLRALRFSGVQFRCFCANVRKFILIFLPMFSESSHILHIRKMLKYDMWFSKRKKNRIAPLMYNDLVSKETVIFYPVRSFVSHTREKINKH